MLDALRRGEIVSIQGDRVVGDVAPTDGRLFGRCAQLPNGPFILARAAEVPIFPLFIVRGGYRSYEIIVREPIRVCRHSVERQNDIAPAVTQWCNVLEQTIAQHCSQWFGFAPVFARAEAIGVFLIGSGRDVWTVPAALRMRFHELKLNVETTRTGTVRIARPAAW